MNGFEVMFKFHFDCECGPVGPARSNPSWHLNQQRKEFAVGAVLESILSEQELTRARLDYLNIIAEFNKAQYTLKKALGGLNEDATAEPAK